MVGQSNVLGTPTSMHVHLLPAVFPVPPGREVGHRGANQAKM